MASESKGNFAMDVAKERKAILKNVVLISLGFTLLFTAYSSMSVLQSSINQAEGLGTWSLASTYAALVLSCMFLPTFLIQRFTVKWTMVVCMLCYSTYMVAQFYPKYYTLIPGAIILGFGAAPMWSAKCTYLTQVGTKYASLGDIDSEQIIVRFFGIFFLFFQSSSVWGNIISSTVLGQNATDSDIDPEMCGVNFCPSTLMNNSNTFNISDTKRYTLASVYLVCSLLGALFIALTVDPLQKFVSVSERSAGLSGVDLLVATFHHMANPYQILIIPLTMWSGFEQAFLASEFTAGYISCAWGVSNVGYVLICYGLCDAVCSIMFGTIMKHTGGRIPIFIFGALLNFGVIVAFFVWTPNKDEKAVFFVLAGLWGISDAIWQTQINAFYGVLFPKSEEAAFSNYRLWESVGFIIAFAYSEYICVDAKLYVLVAILSLGMLGYGVVEVLQRRGWRLHHINSSAQLAADDN